jgi:HD superfamily phosphohydrolases
MENLPLLFRHIMAKLDGLSKELKYHGVNHTLDVYKQSENIALGENITDPSKLYLLKVAALYHDTGFLYMYNGHEEMSCKIATRELPAYGLNEEQIGIICGLVMATKIPQSPKNHLEQIICDADLDCLGRDDYDITSSNLYHELLREGLVKNDDEWLDQQISFLESHQYFTDWSKENRAPLKQQNYERLKLSTQSRKEFK